MNESAGNDPEDDRPPMFRYWSGWYGLVIGVLAGLILLFYFITSRFP